LHANLRGAWEGHGLGLISIGVFIGKKIYFLEHQFAEYTNNDAIVYFSASALYTLVIELN